MAELDVELSAYRGRLFELETHHMGKWVVFHGGNFVGAYSSFEEAAREAVAKFGRGPYLIRQVGAPPITLPICVAHRIDKNGNQVRI